MKKIFIIIIVSILGLSETSYSNSKPIVKLVNSKTNYNFIISLSHDNNLAVAVVISEEIK